MPRLRTAHPAAPGWTLSRTGAGYRLLDQAGVAIVGEAERQRVDALVIPPAWSEVWICPHPNGHIQAIGTDVSGRKQYLYHEQWQRTRSAAKFDRALELASQLPAARALVTRDLRGDVGSRARALAVGFRLLDSAYLRVGSERYALAHGSHGLTTLQGAHARVSGESVVLNFVGKSSVEWSSETSDPDLAIAVRSLKRRGPSSRLLAWKDGGRWRPLRPEEVNEYVREKTHGEFTAKDFRTLHGSIIAATELATQGLQPTATATRRAESAAVNRTAELLGNTAAVARSGYIDPRIFDEYRAGALLETGSRAAEGALRRLVIGPDA